MLLEGGPETFVIYAETSSELKSLLSLLSSAQLPEPAVQSFVYDPNEWVEKWKEFYDWVRISDRLAVGPECKQCPFPALHRVTIEPGQAFGTGTHESTQLALALIDRHISAGDRFCEPGCGSGILSIAARKLGASLAVGFDYDKPSVLEAAHNAGRNHVEASFYRGGADPIAAQFDLVAANILGHLLLTISGPVKRMVRPGGKLVLAGLVPENRPDFEDEFFKGEDLFERIELTAIRGWWGGAWRRVGLA